MDVGNYLPIRRDEGGEFEPVPVVAEQAHRAAVQVVADDLLFVAYGTYRT